MYSSGFITAAGEICINETDSENSLNMIESDSKRTLDSPQTVVDIKKPLTTKMRLSGSARKRFKKYLAEGMNEDKN